MIRVPEYSLFLQNRENVQEKPEIQVPDCDYSHCFPASDEIPAKLYSSPSNLFDYCYGQFIYPLILGRDFKLQRLFDLYNRPLIPDRRSWKCQKFKSPKKAPILGIRKINSRKNN